MSKLSPKERLDKLTELELRLGECMTELKELRYDGVPKDIDLVTCSIEEERMSFVNDAIDDAREEYRTFILRSLRQAEAWLERLI